MEPRNQCQGINSASLCILAGRYDNPIPTRCLAPIDFLKIPAQAFFAFVGIGSKEKNVSGIYLEITPSALQIHLVTDAMLLSFSWGGTFM